jgi:cytoskeletal protein CcmA (bactofilin family)
MSEYYASGSTSGYTTPKNLKRSRSISSDDEINVQGPLEVAGSVQSGRGINFQGNVSVRGAVDAYGNITTRGEMSCQ